MYARTIKIFADEPLNSFLEARLKRLEQEVQAEDDNYILNVNEAEYIEHLTNMFLVDNLELDFESMSVSTDRKEIPAEHFPGGGFTWSVERGRKYLRNVVRYHIPYLGDQELLTCRPSTYSLSEVNVSVNRQEICFDIIDFDQGAEPIRQAATSNQEYILRHWERIKTSVASFNQGLQSKAIRVFRSRKEELLKRNDLMASLGVPLKKRENLPQTFAVPTPATRKKITATKPAVTEKGYRPEPTLEDSTYREILRYLHDWGKELERMPSTYSGKSEEDLRDMFLAFIEPHFEGTATGETFNKSGKTDILLRFEGKNVFVAECKRWRGQQSYLDAISQLLGYLTWRDSKAAVMMFIKNKDISSVLQTIEQATSEHPNHLGLVSKQDESWLDYRFHLDGDPNREVKLAVLMFHYPENQ
jgi:hypothetical protein